MKFLHKPNLRFFLLVVVFSLVFLCAAVTAADSQSSKDVVVQSPSSSGQSSSEQFFRFWFEITPPSQSKKDFEFRPPSSPPKAPSDPQELRYLMLGSIDPELALIIRLTDKAKERRIDPNRFADYLAAQQLPFRNYLSLHDRINNLVLELCLYDLGKVSRNNLVSYMQRLRFTSYLLSSEENTFNYIIELIENNIFSTTEAIDSLILLKQKTTSRW
ncbi:hypothetical protein [Capillibacterium thermochitinicola]|uniref:Uncharacterized protein n=1 Tax=Capillibacterium thermochitinicola TaxID=2699427 RepID=A0A8J6I1N4_9FIRM|nr:hypothetical protein [Capillibacterium thermochitinicola]MBA2132637.1 hypothetical protein [Capillibacterium thermochitinicola]